KNLSLFKSYASEPIVVRADSLRLTQVLVNLIGNAIKFTEQGSITIKTELKSKKDANNREFLVGTVTICDTGVGIEPQLQEKMFEAFMMEDGSTTRKYGGIGLGLTISQKFIKRMGGQLTLTSEGKGCGTTLEVSLPLALSSAGSQLSDVPEQKQTLVERS
ncbi:MAG: ATP-binding protein, partial [Geitlerinemataceae cyanobacterium]